MTSTYTVAEVYVGRPKSYQGGPGGRAWTSGLDKAAVRGRVDLKWEGLAGDEQADLVNHGGPDKAVCVYPLQHYEFWRNEVPTLPNPAFGENISILEGSEQTTCIGDIWEMGSILVQVSQPRSPCWKVASRWGLPRLPSTMQRTGRTGWYMRVLRPGEVEAGNIARLVERPNPEWTIADANEVMYRRRSDAEAALALSVIDELGRSWATKLAARAGRTSAHEPPAFR